MKQYKFVKNCKPGNIVLSNYCFEFSGATVGINSYRTSWICGQMHGQETLLHGCVACKQSR